jgi:recombination protein RecA
MKRTREKLSAQVERKIKNAPERKTPEYDGSDMVVSTGSTLLDLAISGGRFPEGGIPTGILVEIFGPSGAGKTVLLCQIAGNVQRLGGAIKFHDPEARLNKQFARMFGLDVPDENYHIPSTIPEVFSSVRDWLTKDKGESELRGVFADSLAALSTDMEMEGTDKYGMRRAKEFSEELRKTCRMITQSGALVVCSNQVRQNLDAGPYGQRYKSPGGEAIGFYASLRLRCGSGEKIKVSRSIHGKEHKRVIGVKTNIEVFKSSVWKPFRTAEVYIIFDYGIDDIRANLKFVKDSTGDTIYRVGDVKLGKTLDRAIREVEERGLEQELRRQTIEIWQEIEATFEDRRKPRGG